MTRMRRMKQICLCTMRFSTPRGMTRMRRTKHLSVVGNVTTAARHDTHASDETNQAAAYLGFSGREA